MDAPGLALHAAAALSAFLYASVGHGGASAYLAALALMGYSAQKASLTALVLNIIVSAVSFTAYSRAGHFRWKLLTPFLIASIPAAFAGGLVKVSGSIFELLLGLSLMIAAARLAGLGAGHDAEPRRPLPLPAALGAGGAIGLVSGMIGIGGGIFLSPLLLLCRWATTKEASAAAAAFIFLNSASGLVARLSRGEGSLLPETWTLVLAAVLGGSLGARAGAGGWSSVTLRRVLALVLVTAGGKLLFSGLRG